MLKISCRETGHYQACRQAGEDASPDHGDSRGRSTAEPIFPGQPCRRGSAAAAAASITGSVVHRRPRRPRTKSPGTSLRVSSSISISSASASSGAGSADRAAARLRAATRRCCVSPSGPFPAQVIGLSRAGRSRCRRRRAARRSPGRPARGSRRTGLRPSADAPMPHSASRGCGSCARGRARGRRGRGESPNRRLCRSARMAGAGKD